MSSGKKEYDCFIVDDNELDRRTTAAFVRGYPFLNIAGLFDNALPALEAAATAPPDLVLLDIDMPGCSGLDLRTKLEKVPACIFVTAYPEYALQSFDVNALDFLIKPLKADRFETSMKRLHYFLDIHYKAELLDHSFGEDSLFIKEGHQQIRIRFSDIIYLEALKDYTGLITRERKYCVLTPLGNLLTEERFRDFVRIHRSYAVQKHFIRKVSPRSVMVDNVPLPVGRTYRHILDSLLTR
jgi:two-component system LytT family response regulator